MNRYVAAGIARDAASGRRVIVVSKTLGLARAAFADIERLAEHRPSQVVRSNGRETMTWPSGGRVSISSAQSRAHRGVSADVVFVDGEAAHDIDVIREVSPCIAGRPGGEVIRA